MRFLGGSVTSVELMKITIPIWVIAINTSHKGSFFRHVSVWNFWLISLFVVLSGALEMIKDLR